MDSLQKCTSILQNYCDDIHDKTSSLQERMELQFNRSYADRDPKSASSSQYNPIRLVARLESAKSQHANFSGEFSTLVKEIHRIPAKSLQETHNETIALLQLLPEDSEKLSTHSAELVRAADDFHRDLEQCVQTLTGVSAELAHADKIEINDPNISPESSPSGTSTQRSVPPPSKKNVKAKENANGRKKVPPRLRAEKERKLSGQPNNGRPGRDASPSSARSRRPASTRNSRAKAAPVKKVGESNGLSSPKYVPIQKSAYNRLPRNLKLGAGKLDPLNELYKKTFDALCANQGALSNVELMKATGEPNSAKFDALRGLSVLSKTDAGWELVATRASKR